jgi:hypothetical protein
MDHRNSLNAILRPEDLVETRFIASFPTIPVEGRHFNFLLFNTTCIVHSSGQRRDKSRLYGVFGSGPMDHRNSLNPILRPEDLVETRFIASFPTIPVEGRHFNFLLFNTTFNCASVWAETR